MAQLSVDTLTWDEVDSLTWDEVDGLTWSEVVPIGQATGSVTVRPAIHGVVEVVSDISGKVRIS